MKQQITYPHQEVIQHYEIDIEDLPKNSKELVQNLENRIEKISSLEDDEKVEELKDIVAKSKMLAATIIAKNKKKDSEKEQKEIEEDVKASVDAIKEEIKKIEEEEQKKKEEEEQKKKEEEEQKKKEEEEQKKKEEEEQKKKEEEEQKKKEEEEQKEDDEIPPPSKESKLEKIISFFEEKKTATISELKELGLTNITPETEEIELVENKYKIVKKSEDKYILKKKDDGILGWVVLGISVAVAGFFGIKYLNKKNQ